MRVCTSGAAPIGCTMQVGEVEIAYFPEGVRYGPQEGGPDRRGLCQVGGAPIRPGGRRCR
jgi:hypothetical protein